MTQSLLTRPDRLSALRRTALLDTPPEESFDRLTRMAARLLGTPVSLIALVADDRQFFKSAVGLPEPYASRRVTPISFSFCGQVVATGDPLILEDARRHPLLRHNPVIRELGWVAYAGVPLVTRHGHPIGALCVADKTPRLWSERDMALLQDLAASVVTEIELRTEISERRNAEHSRRESVEQFHSSFEESGIGMALLSTDGRWLRVNRAVSDLLGRPPEDLIGLAVQAVVHPEDASASREAMRLLQAGECRTYTMELRYVRPSGAVVWALVNVSLVPGPEGEPGHYIAGIQDITERKLAEIALRESEDRYRLLVRTANETIWDWDLLTDRIVWDPGAGPLLDYEFSQLGDTVGWWYERIHPADRERVMGSIDAALSEARAAWTEEYRFRRADGTYTRVQNRAHIAHDESGTPNRVISAVSPATRSEGPERHLQQVLDALKVGVSVIDRQGRIVAANASARQLWGGADAAVLQFAQHRAWWADTGEPVRPEEWGAARAIQGEFSAEEEVFVEMPDGVQRLIRSSAAPITDERGEIVGAVNVTEDVTGVRTAEDARVREEDEQRRAEKMEAVGRLAGGIAHDFNNLLTGILSYSDLILQELRPADPLRADVEQIRDAGQRAAGLTRQLLAFSRRQLLQPKVVSLNSSVRQLEPMLDRLAGPAVSLETQLDPALGTVLVDPGALEQVLVNLVTNAREAMPHGGQLRIVTANSGAAGSAPEYVSLWVTDTGTGMDPTVLSHIFEPFFSTKRGGSGTGLGLSTVYGIVEQSGGKITVESTLGEGSTFGIHFPWHGAGEQPAPGPRRRSAKAGRERILLVDDEPQVRESVRRLLLAQDYTVVEASHANEAIRIYEGAPSEIDLVLTDVTMPGMSGYDLAEHLRASAPDLPIVFMSGYSETPGGTGAGAGGRTGYIQKPFQLEDLLERLRKVLER
jgi:PAS domain S-box-containing protein